MIFKQLKLSHAKFFFLMNSCLKSKQPRIVERLWLYKYLRPLLVLRHHLLVLSANLFKLTVILVKEPTAYKLYLLELLLALFNAFFSLLEHVAEVSIYQTLHFVQTFSDEVHHLLFLFTVAFFAQCFNLVNIVRHFCDLLRVIHVDIWNSFPKVFLYLINKVVRIDSHSLNLDVLFVNLNSHCLIQLLCWAFFIKKINNFLFCDIHRAIEFINSQVVVTHSGHMLLNCITELCPHVLDLLVYRLLNSQLLQFQIIDVNSLVLDYILQLIKTLL